MGVAYFRGILILGDFMIEDILAITKYFVLFIGSFYGYFKLSKTKLRIINLLDILIAIIFSIGLYYATKQLQIIIPLCFLLLSYLYIIIRVRHSLLNTATICLISCGITIIIMAFAFIVSIPINYLIFLIIPNTAIRDCVAIIASDLLQLLFTFLIYKIKRFKSGITIQDNDGNIELLILVSILSIFLLTLTYTENVANSPLEIILLTLIFCGLELIIWWKKYVTNKYHTKIYKRNEALYEHRIEEYENERNNLLNQNTELSKIIHRDNKLIPAMVMAVKELINNAPDNAELNALLEQLEELSTEHREIIDAYQAKSDDLPKTNVIPIDAVLHYILSKAKQNNIEFTVNIANDCIHNLLSQITDIMDLTTILCDLGENAVIATKNISGSKILITFENSGSNVPSICVFDNGPLFDEKVIANMGKKRITTHKDDGGTGIGLMTLFEILNKYNASFCLDEKPNNEFTKYIRITFDNLHNVEILR